MVEVTVRAEGPGILQAEIVSNLGVLSSQPAVDEYCEFSYRFEITKPSWIAARVTGEVHPDVLAQPSFAHTSPVYMNVGGRRVAEVSDAAWCLDWLDRFESLVKRAGRFSLPSQREELLEVVDAARNQYLEVLLARSSG
jgi:hypothetical protein